MNNFKTVRPETAEYPEYFEGYVSLVPEGDVIETLRRQFAETLTLLSGITEERASAGYAPGKWSVKELLGHVSDAERVFAYRALCIARGDTQSLPGMDQDVYVAHANFNARTLADLTEEFKHVRASTIDLLSHLDEAAWQRRGVANEKSMSVRALAHIIAGHEAHHAGVLRERYLPALGVGA
jgi:uncharacterized damage-inducible protein DinB